jgi:hypothetical protein
MTRLYLVKTQGGDLIGESGADQDYIARLGEGDILECDTRKARHPAHHRKFFALLNSAFENQDKYRNRTDLLVALKLRCGWYDEYITHDGKLVYIPQSLSWARMGQEDFAKFYNEAIVALADMFGTEDVVLEADQIIARTA